jgi:hypothetical protein
MKNTQDVQKVLQVTEHAEMVASYFSYFKLLQMSG